MLRNPRAFAVSLVGALLAMLVLPTATAGAAPKNSFTYGCTLTLEICEEAGTRAGTDPAAVARYLDTAAKQTSAIAASLAPEYGSLTHDGRNGRFYGWRLSRDVLNGGIKIGYYRCQRVNGQPANCVRHGDVGVMASFNFNGHQARQIRTVMTNMTPLSLQVRHRLTCLPGGAGCSGLITTPISPMPPSLPNTEEGTTFYLPNAGTYQLAFSWQITDPGWANSVATTETFGSIRFHCEQLGPATDPGECYFQGLSPA